MAKMALMSNLRPPYLRDRRNIRQLLARQLLTRQQLNRQQLNRQQLNRQQQLLLLLRRDTCLGCGRRRYWS